MQDIIHELVEIDADARKLTDDAQSKRRDVGRIIAGRIAVLRERYKKEADERCESFKKSGSETADQTIASLREKSAAAVARLREAQKAHGSEWSDVIFRAITGRE
jgi:hypothetical protein